MSRRLKTVIYDEIKKRFANVDDGFVMIDYHGLNSEQTQDLRCQLRHNGVRMTVVQNRLARRFFAGAKLPESLGKTLRGPTALLVGKDGALSASKSIIQWRKKNKDRASIRGGLFRGKVLSPEDVAELSKMPDAATMQRNVVGLLLGPLNCLASAAQTLLGHFAGAVKARREALENEVTKITKENHSQ